MDFGTGGAAVVGSLELSRALEESVEAARSTKTERSVPDVLGDSLTSLLGRPWSTRDHEVLTLIAAGWNGRRDPESARDLLLNLLGKGLDGALGLLVREEVAFWIGEAGDPDAARDQYTALLPDQDRFLGPDHPATLTTRGALALVSLELGAMPAELDGSSEEVINWVSLHVSSHSVTPDRSASLTRGLAGLPGSATIVEATPILQLLRLKRPGSHRDWIAAYRAAGGPVQGVTDNVATALDGDPESLMRLPEELRDLVTQRTAVPG